MRSMFVALAFCLAAAVASSPLQAQEFSSLEERMSAREFKDAGLDKLSAEELANLNRWLRERAAPSAPAAAPTASVDRTGLPAIREEADKVVSRLMGSFRGWSGNTTFQLENGQVWRQTDGSVFGGVNLESPQVTIDKGLFGAWYLHVEGYNSRAKVKRIR
jgi:hypothetical protein